MKSQLQPGAAVEALRDLRILVVEDEYFLADDIARALGAVGAVVVGPVGDARKALDLATAEDFDGALIDINLHGDLIYAIADVLLDRAVPFLFATGYARSSLPARFEAVPHFEKPVEASVLVEMLATVIRGARAPTG